MVFLGGAGMAFGEEQQPLMTGSLVPRLPSCGEQRSLGGLESFWSSWSQAGSSGLATYPQSHV